MKPMNLFLLPLLPVIALAEVVTLAVEIPLGASGAASDAIDKFGAKTWNKIVGKEDIDISTVYPNEEGKR